MALTCGTPPVQAYNQSASRQRYPLYLYQTRSTRSLVSSRAPATKPKSFELSSTGRRSTGDGVRWRLLSSRAGLGGDLLSFRRGGLRLGDGSGRLSQRVGLGW